MRFIMRWLINAVALYVAVAIVPGITVQSTGWLSFIWLALIFGFLNALVRPVLKFLTCPLIFLTLGLFTLVINTFMFWLAGEVGTKFGVGFTVAGFWPAFLGGLIVTLISIALTMIFRDEKRHHH
jgi:putative membrane protein